MDGADIVSVQRVSRDRVEERATLAGRTHERVAPMPWHHLRLEPRAAARMHELVSKGLRGWAVLLWGAPVLVALKLVTWALGLWVSDLLTVIFVLVVVALFATMVLWAVTFTIAGPRAQREAASALRVQLTGAADFQRVLATLPFSLPRTPTRTLEAWANGEQAPAGIRVRGTVDAGADVEPGEPVLVEQWREDDDGALARLVTGRWFVVRVEDAPPIVVQLGAAPILLAPPVDAAALAVADPPAGEVRGTIALCQGDEVELIATQVTRRPRLEDLRIGERRPGFAARGEDYRREGTPALDAVADLQGHLLLCKRG